MGAADMETVVTVDLSTATRKERQFQVVPVPGHFTRGRWKCWDYKDDKTQQQPDSDKDAVTETSTIIITASASTVPDLEPLNQDLINALETTPVKEKETSTIVVTSIAPHPTPIHGTPISVRDELLTEDMVSKLQHTLPDIVATTGAVVVTVPGEIHIQQVSVAQVSSGQPTPLPQVASAPTAGAMVGRPAAEIAEDENVATANGAPPPNIDNKIEQAMDLVKTHLTFAVREEIDFLRQTIVELEAKIQVVENENQLLRQYAPAEVVNNLATLVAQQKAQNGPSTTPSAIATASAIAAKVQPSSFCSTELANTLNNVVADVRQSIRNPNPQ